MPAAQADALINAFRSHDTRDDFNRYMYRQMVNQQYALTLRGGTAKATYLFAAGYDANSSNLDDKYRRLSFKTENSFNLGSRLQLTAAVSYTNSQAKAGRTGYNNTSTVNGVLPPYIMMADSNGNALPVMKQYRQPYTDTAGGGKLLNWNYYLLDDYQHVQNTNNMGLLMGSLGINCKIFKSLSASVKYRYELQQGSNDILYDEQSFFARDQVNTFSQLNRATGLVTYIVPRGGILQTNNSKQQAHNLRGQLNYNGIFKNHELNAIAGAEARQLTGTGSTYRTYGYKPGILAFSPVDFVNQYPRFISGTLANILNDQDFSEKQNRFISVYANLAYTFKKRYGLSASGRRDASNLYGVRTNDKWTPLWSAGASWELSKEPWFRFKPLSFLKLRGTWGVSGNADASRSGFTVLAYSVNSAYTQLPTAVFNQFANPDLRWERSTMLNLGIDFKGFNNRLEGSVEYYQKKGKDLLGFAAVDYTAVPTNRIAKNVATMRGSGWDISLNSINLNRALQWATSLNFNINSDKVTSYLLTTRSATSYLNGGLNISAVEGRPVYGLYAYRWAGLDAVGDPMSYINGQPSKDYNTLGATAYPVDSLKYMGRSLPAVFGSMGNTVSYKGISLTLRIAFKAGYYFMRNSINYSSLFSTRQGHGDYALRWQKPGDELITSVPAMVYPAVSRRDQLYTNSEVLVEKADHVRLQYITLNYNLKTAFKKLKLQSLDMYVNINNLGILWRANKQGIDPDYRDNTILPPANIAIGIRTIF